MTTHVRSYIYEMTTHVRSYIYIMPTRFLLTIVWFISKALKMIVMAALLGAQGYGVNYD